MIIAGVAMTNEVFGGQSDDSALLIADFDRWIAPDNLGCLCDGMRIIVAVRLSPQCNMVIRCEQVESIERHSRPTLLTPHSFGTYDASRSLSSKNGNWSSAYSVLFKEWDASQLPGEPTAMPISRMSLTDLQFAVSLRLMSDEEFLLAWQGEVIANDGPRIALVESAATRRFGLSTWHHRYAARFPNQTRYRLPTRG